MILAKPAREARPHQAKQQCKQSIKSPLTSVHLYCTRMSVSKVMWLRNLPQMSADAEFKEEPAVRKGDPNSHYLQDIYMIAVQKSNLI